METIIVLLLITLSPVTVVLLPIHDSGSQQTSFSSLMDCGGRKMVRLSPSKNIFNTPYNEHYQITSSRNIRYTAKSAHELPDGGNICSSCVLLCIHTSSIQQGQQLLLNHFTLMGAGELEYCNMITYMMRYKVAIAVKHFRRDFVPTCK